MIEQNITNIVNKYLTMLNYTKNCWILIITTYDKSQKKKGALDLVECSLTSQISNVQTISKKH